MLKAVQDRAREAGMSNISIIEGGFDAIMSGHGSLDAAVGRRVLMYQPDAVNAVTQLARAVRPGGLVAFHEHDTIPVNDGRALLPLHDQVRGWLREMLRHEGANLNMGFDLHGALSAAGLVVERVRAQANLLTPTSDYPIATIIRAVLPRLLANGVVTEEDVDIETLDARLAAERRKANATVVWEMVFCAWARKP
jgi:SAM-dependent methyltransferase